MTDDPQIYYSSDALTELDAVCDRFRDHLFEAAEIAAAERNTDTVEIMDIPSRIDFDCRDPKADY